MSNQADRNRADQLHFPVNIRVARGAAELPRPVLVCCCSDFHVRSPLWSYTCGRNHDLMSMRFDPYPREVGTLFARLNCLYC